MKYRKGYILIESVITLSSNILVISQKGKILGAASYSGIDKIGEL